MAYFYHATTPENMKSIMNDLTLKADAFGEVFLCKEPLDACKFLAIWGIARIDVIEVELEESDVDESHDHSESFFQCKAYIHHGDIELKGEEKITEDTFDSAKKSGLSWAAAGQTTGARRRRKKKEVRREKERGGGEPDG